ncbi:MAG: hypothetical protein HYV95_09725 [Opitutae bacterium]|nr:hypothetical protein [Opitutae bacterium]
MKTRISLAGVCFVALCGALAAAPDASIKVEASRAMKMAVIDSDRKNPASEQVQQTFAESLGFELSQRCKAPVPVKPSTPDVQRAAWGLSNGVYDVVIVLGASVPSALVSSDFRVLKAVPVSGDLKRALCMIIRVDDPGLASMLEASFPEALKGQFFQKAIARYSGKAISEGDGGEWKIAGLGAGAPH